MKGRGMISNRYFSRIISLLMLVSALTVSPFLVSAQQTTPPQDVRDSRRALRASCTCPSDDRGSS